MSKDDRYLVQDEGTCCFVYAVANCLIYFGLPVPDLEEAFDIALCRHGGTIKHQDVVDYMKAPLEPVGDYNLVLDKGGVLNISHPIWNGHCLFCYPSKRTYVTIINSWLGPNVVEVGREEIEQFVPPLHNFGKYWAVVRNDRSQKDVEKVERIWS